MDQKTKTLQVKDKENFKNLLATRQMSKENEFLRMANTTLMKSFLFKGAELRFRCCLFWQIHSFLFRILLGQK
jgi:hypothetical protein